MLPPAGVANAAMAHDLSDDAAEAGDDAEDTEEHNDAVETTTAPSTDEAGDDAAPEHTQ